MSLYLFINHDILERVYIHLSIMIYFK